MTAHPLPSADFLHRLLDYDPFTGLLRWKYRAEARACWNTRYAGEIAGTPLIEGKYILLRIAKKPFLAHRIIFKMMTGRDPAGEVDHRDLDGTNNRWLNLRDSTKSQNASNVAVRSHSKIGLKGVTFHKETGKYRARVRCNGVVHECGLHATPEAAHLAYTIRAKELHGEFSREG